MKTRSGMPYDVVAFSTDEAAMLWTLDEEGAFHRLMRHAWMNGSIPDDPSALASICRCPPDLFGVIWRKLETSWPRAEDGRRRNPKQEEERGWISSKSKANANAARQRWQPHPKRKANAMRTHSKRNAPLPSSLLLKEEEKVSPLSRVFGEFQSVRLTDVESDKLEVKIGAAARDSLITELDLYSQSNPRAFKKYQSHYATIRNWAKRREPGPVQKPLPMTAANISPRDFL